MIFQERQEKQNTYELQFQQMIECWQERCLMTSSSSTRKILKRILCEQLEEKK